MPLYINAPGAPSAYMTRYTAFGGVDFSQNPSLIDPARSPYALNLVSDDGGYPEKRVGYETVVTEAEGRNINGMYLFSSDGEEIFIVHAGDRLYRLQDDLLTLIHYPIADRKSSALPFGGKLYMVTGEEYIEISNSGGTIQVAAVYESAFVPTTVIARGPTGGGELFEQPNLLTTQRKNCFLSDGKSSIYQLDSEVDTTKPIRATINGIPQYHMADYVTDASGQITFAGIPDPPTIPGKDNIEVTFYTPTSERHKIEGCTLMTSFGPGNRFFFAGNEQHKNTDWYSQADNPAYIPEFSYSFVGGDESAIVGYLRGGNMLLVIKEYSPGDFTVFARTVDYMSDGQVVFPLNALSAGVGGLSAASLCQFRDDPVFLSEQGVFGIGSSDATDGVFFARSSRVNKALLALPDLKNVVSTLWKDYMILCSPSTGHCYVADSRKRTPSTYSFEYEWYHWDNIHAKVFLPVKDTLYFGTADGKINRFKQGDSLTRFNDNGEAIVAVWSTKADDDGDFTAYKTLLAHGSGVLTKAYDKSSISVSVSTDSSEYIDEGSMYLDRFSFTELDFSRLSFVTDYSPRFVPLKTVVRNYITAMITVKNDGLNEGFGVYAIVKKYRMGVRTTGL